MINRRTSPPRASKPITTQRTKPFRPAVEERRRLQRISTWWEFCPVDSQIPPTFTPPHPTPDYLLKRRRRRKKKCVGVVVRQLKCQTVALPPFFRAIVTGVGLTGDSQALIVRVSRAHVSSRKASVETKADGRRWG